MAQAYFESEEKDLVFDYISNHKHQNLHVRGTREVKTKRVLAYLNTLALVNKRIVGHVCGTEAEIEYEVLPTGAIVITNSNLSDDLSYAYMNKLKKKILEVANRGDSTFPPKRTNGQYYIQRGQKEKHSEAAEEAVEKGIVSQRFADDIYQRLFEIIKKRG